MSNTCANNTAQYFLVVCGYLIGDTDAEGCVAIIDKDVFFLKESVRTPYVRVLMIIRYSSTRETDTGNGSQ